jgi:hypothetical protein
MVPLRVVYLIQTMPIGLVPNVMKVLPGGPARRAEQAFQETT